MSVTRDPVVVVCAIDPRYVLPLAVMLRSVAEHMRDDREITCYVIHAGVSQADRERVCETLPQSHFEVRWIAADSSGVRGLPTWGRMPVTTYFKLLVPELLPSSVNRALWLDCDMLVTRDILSLWNAGLEGNAVGAVQDQLVPFVSSRGGIARWSQMGLHAGTKYFNAGVMLMDLAAWRRDGIARNAMDYLRTNARSVMFWDQEGLNAALAGKWKELPRCWNVNVSLPGWRSAPRDRAPAILHFAGMLKPWEFRTSDPEWSLYNQYLDHTAWAGLRPGQTPVRLAISLYERSGVRSLTHSFETLGVMLARRLSFAPVGRTGVNVVSGVPLESQ